MAKRGSISRRVLALIFTLAVFFTASGFTFNPSEPLDFYAYVEFNDDGSGTLQSKTENLTLTRIAYYSGSYTAEDGKAGAVGSADWQQHLCMLVNTEKFKDVHKVKVTVEWYDAAGQAADNFFSVQYPNTAGGRGEPATKTNEPGSGTKSWVTTEIIISDADFTVTNRLQQGANLEVYVPKAKLTTHNTDDASDDYYGVAVHSVKVEPMEESYRLAQFKDAAVARWQAGETEDTSENIQMLTAPTATRTITDAKGVTMTGKAWGANSGNRMVSFFLDKEKFADAGSVNITVKWFDAVDTPKKNSINVRWMSTDLHPTVSWMGYLKETGAVWTEGIGEWKTSTYTLTSCDFKDPEKNKDLNFYIDTNKTEQSIATSDGSSDKVCGTLISEVIVERIPEWTFTGLKFTDENSNELTALNAGGDFHTELTVKRTDGSGAADVTLIVALMDENGRLERIAAEKKSIEPNNSKLLSVCFKNPETVAGKTVRVMVWDSLTGLSPISNLLTCS